MNNDFQAQAYNENEMINELLDRVEKHDYSYMFSDDHRSWMGGTKSEKMIEQLIHGLCSVMKVDAMELLNDCLEVRSEQYTDGLTHKIIRGWFSNYIGK